MSSGVRDDSDERELWREYRDSQGRSIRDRCPTHMELAEYVDGRASGVTRDSVEGHLTRCAECSGAVLELGDLIRGGVEPVPPGVAIAARAWGLSPPGRGSQWMPPPLRASLIRWGTLAAALSGVAYFGYALGELTGWARHSTQSTVLSESSFGMPDFARPLGEGSPPADPFTGDNP